MPERGGDDSGAKRRAPALPSLPPAFPVVAGLAAVASAALFLGREHAIAGTWGYSLDDSWIHAVIARNFATGHGWSFNPGETTGASTAPLFTFLLAAFYAATGPSVWVSKGIGIACHAAASVLVCLAAFTLLERDRSSPSHSSPPWLPSGIALLCGVLVAVAPPLVWGSVSGMEVPLYELLLVAGINWHLRGHGLLAVGAWAAGVWVRPDGLLLALLGAMLGGGRWLPRLATVAAVLAPYFAVQYLIGGAPLPATVYAKSHVAANPLGQVSDFFFQQRALWGFPGGVGQSVSQSPLLLAIALVGIRAGGRRTRLLAAYGALFPLAFGVASSNPGPNFRYVLSLVPVAVVLASPGIGAIVSRVARPLRASAFAALAAVLLGVPALALSSAADAHGWNVQNIDGMHRFLGEHFQNTTSPSDRIATNDVGAIGYFSGRYIVDVAGLLTPRKPLPELLTEHRPRLLAVFPHWYQGYAGVDSVANTLYFDDADGKDRYWGTYYVELRHNTVVARDVMVICERTPRGEPPPERLPGYAH